MSRLSLKQTTPLRLDSLTFAFIALLALAFFDCLSRFLSFCIFGDVVSHLACFLIGLLCCAAALFLLRGQIALYAPAFNKIDILFVCVFTLYFFMKAVFPDGMADTLNYEIFVQEFSFTSKLEALKPDLPSFAAWYSLGERVFYYFRVVFGYRLSILPNLLIFFVVFYKTKEILTGFFKEAFPEKLKRFRPSMAASIISGAAFLIFCDEFILMGAVIIKPDLFVIPLLLECFRIVFQSGRRDAGVYALAGVFAGLSTAVKLTSMLYFLPIIAVIIYTDVRQKTFAPKKLIWGALGVVLTTAPFVLYSFIFTGSPAFPFFNAVFASPNASTTGIDDTRWGPQSLLQTLLWPFIVVFDTSRYGELISDVAFSNARLAIGCTAAAVSCFVYKKAGLGRRLPIALFILASTFLWSAITGYIRYGMVIGLLAFIYLAVFIMDMLALRKRILAAAAVSLATASLIVSFLLVSFYNFDWSFRPSVFKGSDWTGGVARPNYELIIRYYGGQARANLPRVLNDHTATDDHSLQERFDSVKTWVLINGFTVDAVIANPKASLFICGMNVWSEKSPADFARRYFGEHSSEGLFALTRYFDDATRSAYEQSGFTVEEIEEVSLNHMDAHQIAYFMRLTFNPG